MSHYFASVHSLSTIEPLSGRKTGRSYLLHVVVGDSLTNWPTDKQQREIHKDVTSIGIGIGIGGYRFPRSPMSKVSFCQKQQECKECKERLMNLFFGNFLLWNNPSLDFMLFAQILKNHNPPFLSFNGSNLKVLWRTEGYLTPTGAWLF